MGWPSWAESSDWTALGSDHGNDPRAFSWGGTPEHGPGYRELLIDHPTAVSLPARSDIQGPKPLSRIGGSVVHEHGLRRCWPTTVPPGGGDGPGVRLVGDALGAEAPGPEPEDAVPDPLRDGAGLPTRTPSDLTSRTLPDGPAVACHSYRPAPRRVHEV